MKISVIKKELENDKTFQHSNKAIGLTFDDFDIIDISSNKYIKKSNSKIGHYAILIANGFIDTIQFDTSNETVRQHRLKIIGR